MGWLRAHSILPKNHLLSATILQETLFTAELTYLNTNVILLREIIVSETASVGRQQLSLFHTQANTHSTIESKLSTRLRTYAQLKTQHQPFSTNLSFGWKIGSASCVSNIVEGSHVRLESDAACVFRNRFVWRIIQVFDFDSICQSN